MLSEGASQMKGQLEYNLKKILTHTVYINCQALKMHHFEWADST